MKKVAPERITFLINAALLNVYFILFFRKEIYFFECFCFNEYDIQMSLYIFWLRKGYVRNWWGDGTYYLVKM